MIERARVAPFEPRTLEAFARENAVEGCVHESFGAVLGLAQAEAAEDPGVRFALRSIARDETRHGALAWAVHRWVLGVLPPEAAARVEAAQRAALDALVARAHETGDALTTEARAALGLPTPAACRALAVAFRGEAEALARAA